MALIADFNPRSRVGSDSVSIHFVHSVVISIRAPAWGATAKTDNKSPIFAPNISTISKTLGSVNWLNHFYKF